MKNYFNKKWIIIMAASVLFFVGLNTVFEKKSSYIVGGSLKHDVVIDRFEGVYAVCENEDGGIVNFNKDKIPVNSKEGDVLSFEDGKLIINKYKTDILNDESLNLMKKLWE